jgi:hypothetical protein
MNRIVLAIVAVVAVVIIFLLVRPKGETKQTPVDTTFKVDTHQVPLESLTTNVPPPAPDTFTPPKIETRPAPTRPQYPMAPEALMEAVRREQSFTQFCYQEFGQKSDPQLRGGVAMLVTVGTSGVTAAHVANDSWTSKFGKAVNRCLNQRAKDAWRLPAGTVKSGQYVVNLTFQPV